MNKLPWKHLLKDADLVFSSNGFNPNSFANRSIGKQGKALDWWKCFNQFGSDKIGDGVYERRNRNSKEIMRPKVKSEMRFPSKDICSFGEIDERFSCQKHAFRCIAKAAKLVSLVFNPRFHFSDMSRIRVDGNV